MSDEKDLQPIEPGDDTETRTGEVVDVAAEDVNPSEAAQPSAQHSSSGESQNRGSLAGTIRETLFKRPGTREQVPATEATGANLSAVTATTVLMNRSGSEEITADRVTMERSGSRTIDAKSVQMDRSGSVALSSDNAVLLNSSAIQIVTSEARLSHSSAIFLSSDKASIEHSRIAIFAGSTDGDVQPLITGQTAGILIGALTAIVAILLALPHIRTRD